MSPEKRILEDAVSEQEPKKLKEADNTVSNESKTTDDNVENGAINEENGAANEEKEAVVAPEEHAAVAEAAPAAEDAAAPAEKKIFAEAGRLILAGATNWALLGRKQQQMTPAQMNFAPRRLKEFADIKIARVASHASATHHIIITDMGQVYMMGRNEKAQLGVGDMEERQSAVQVDELKDMVVMDAAAGKNHSLFLTDDGVVYACGDNKSGQCGVGNTTANILVPTKINFTEGKVTKIACGADFSMILTDKGDLFSFGLPEYGQLGHNTDGKYFVKSNKMSYEFETSPRRITMFVETSKGSHPAPLRDVTIVDVACGNNHSVCIDTKKRIFTWGFGGYGRLGHSDPKDEMMPRLVKFFDRPNGGVSKVFCGATFVLAVSELGIFLWGKTKRTGEANMYPKPVQDLYGWNVRAVGCSVTSIVMAADESVIAWGPSPTYGELGLGEGLKSSTTPKELRALEGAHVLQVACSQGTTLMVVLEETEQDKTIINKLKEISV